MADKLTEIVAWKRQEISSTIRDIAISELERLHAALPAPPSFRQALRRIDGALAVIAEIKRRSPSAGAIAPHTQALEQAQRYQQAGADGLSILTDHKYFGGNLRDLQDVTSSLPSSSRAVPCLRKDFMVHPIQVLEARQAGASAVLIIVRALTDAEIGTLHRAARAAGLDTLFEIHSEPELERALSHGADLIGVNHRDLANFETNLALSEKLIPQFPREVVAVSESGIRTAADAARVKACGAHAVLVGESLMKAADPAALLASLQLAKR